MCKLVIKTFQQANKLASLTDSTILIESASSCLSAIECNKRGLSVARRTLSKFMQRHHGSTTSFHMLYFDLGSFDFFITSSLDCSYLKQSFITFH